MRFHVPAMAALGLAQLASLELRYVELPGLIEHLVTMPVAVNVVPGDEAAGRIPDPVVHTEVLFQEAQQSKRLASEALERGDRAAAKQLLDSAVEMLRDAGDAAPDSIRGEVLLEAADVEAMGARVLFEDAAFTSKLTRASYHQQNRKRGRRSPRDSDRS
jgi:Ca-activated chloride channel family protein